MPLIHRVDNAVQATHRQDIKKLKDDSKLEICVGKPPTYQTQSARTPDATETPAGMPLPIITYMPPEYVPPSTSTRSGSAPSMGGIDFAEYKLTQENFYKLVKL